MIRLRIKGEWKTVYTFGDFRGKVMSSSTPLAMKALGTMLKKPQPKAVALVLKVVLTTYVKTKLDLES